MEKVAVFLDYSNVHLVGHQLFARDLGKWETHLSPIALATGIVAGRLIPSVLSRVLLYRGRPERFREPDAAKLFRSQDERWSQNPLFDGYYRPMVYGAREKPKEAGIDVRLGLDFVRTAHQREYDVLILFSHDADLAPAVEDARRTPTKVELAAWEAGRDTQRALQKVLGSKRGWTHLMDEDFYWDCQDELPSAAA